MEQKSWRYGRRGSRRRRKEGTRKGWEETTYLKRESGEDTVGTRHGGYSRCG